MYQFLFILLLSAFPIAPYGSTPAEKKELPASCRVRLFVAETSAEYADYPEFLSFKQSLSLMFCPLETPSPATVATGATLYSNKLRFTEEGGGTPIGGLPYFVTTDSGMLISGQTGDNGCSVRLYTTGKSDFSWKTGEDCRLAMEKASAVNDAPPAGSPGARQNSAEPSPAEGHWEKVCFIHPKSRRPVTGQPYFIAAKSGHAIAGKTDDSGCSAAVYTPDREPFTVYGGPDAVEMNSLGSED